MEQQAQAVTVSGGEQVAKRTRRHYGLPLRYQQVVCLHLAGKRQVEVSEATGYSAAMVYRILASEDALAYRQQLLANTQQEFEALFSEVVGVVRDKLKSPDEAIQMQAVNTWLRAHGRFTKQSEEGSEVTAEDVVKRLLHVEGNVNIMVNKYGTEQRS